jgi:hypothetical protein
VWSETFTLWDVDGIVIPVHDRKGLHFYEIFINMVSQERVKIRLMDSANKHGIIARGRMDFMDDFFGLIECLRRPWNSRGATVQREWEPFDPALVYQQPPDSMNCGVACILFAQYAPRSMPLTFTDEQVDNARMQLAFVFANLDLFRPCEIVKTEDDDANKWTAPMRYLVHPPVDKFDLFGPIPRSLFDPVRHVPRPVLPPLPTLSYDCVREPTPSTQPPALPLPALSQYDDETSMQAIPSDEDASDDGAFGEDPIDSAFDEDPISPVSHVPATPTVVPNGDDDDEHDEDTHSDRDEDEDDDDDEDDHRGDANKQNDDAREEEPAPAGEDDKDEDEDDADKDDQDDDDDDDDDDNDDDDDDEDDDDAEDDEHAEDVGAQIPDIVEPLLANVLDEESRNRMDVDEPKTDDDDEHGGYDATSQRITVRQQAPPFPVGTQLLAGAVLQFPSATTDETPTTSTTQTVVWRPPVDLDGMWKGITKPGGQVVVRRDVRMSPPPSEIRYQITRLSQIAAEDDEDDEDEEKASVEQEGGTVTVETIGADNDNVDEGGTLTLDPTTVETNDDDNDKVDEGGDLTLDPTTEDESKTSVEHVQPEISPRSMGAMTLASIRAASLPPRLRSTISPGETFLFCKIFCVRVCVQSKQVATHRWIVIAHGLICWREGFMR